VEKHLRISSRLRVLMRSNLQKGPPKINAAAAYFIRTIRFTAVASPAVSRYR